MAETALNGTPVRLIGDLPQPGSFAPDFTLAGSDLTDVSLKDYAGKSVILNIFPSIDQPVCSQTVRKFNAEITGNQTAVVICVSADLPFAQARFCGAEKLDQVITASTFRSPEFGDAYGLRIAEGGMAGLLARAVIVIDGRGKVVYSQLVDDIAKEPDYDRALACLAYQEVVEACTASFTAEHSRGFDDDEPCDDGRAG
jgi:thiol peroxidase